MLLASLYTAIPMFLLLMNAAQAQDGSFCSCTPISYHFTIDFSKKCVDNTFTQGSQTGIERVACIPSSFQAPDAPESDWQLTQIDLIEMLEFDKEGQKFGNSTIIETLNNAQNFTLFSASNPVTSPYPVLIKLTISALATTTVVVDAFPVEYAINIDLTNLCERDVFFNEDSFGPLIFNQPPSVPARDETCLTPLTTSRPTFSVSRFPTKSPTNPPAISSSPTITPGCSKGKGKGGKEMKSSKDSKGKGKGAKSTKQTKDSKRVKSAKQSKESKSKRQLKQKGKGKGHHSDGCEKKSVKSKGKGMGSKSSKRPKGSKSNKGESLKARSQTIGADSTKFQRH